MAKVWLEERLCNRGDLPDVCLKCGRPTTNRVKKTFNWNPPWVWITLVAGLLVLLIVVLVTRKTIHARVPLCDEHRGHWWKRTLLIVLGLFGAIGVTILIVVAIDSMGPGNDAAGLLGLLIPVVFLAWLIGTIVAQVTAIRASEIDDRRGLQLTGVCQEFVDAYREEYDDRRPGRIDRRALEYWDDREPPRRARPVSDDDRRYREEDEDDRPRRRYRDDEDDRRPRRDRDRYRDDY